MEEVRLIAQTTCGGAKVLAAQIWLGTTGWAKAQRLHEIEAREAGAGWSQRDLPADGLVMIPPLRPANNVGLRSG